MPQDWQHVAAYVTQKDPRNTAWLQIHHFFFGKRKEMRARLSLFCSTSPSSKAKSLVFFFLYDELCWESDGVIKWRNTTPNGRQMWLSHDFKCMWVIVNEFWQSQIHLLTLFCILYKRVPVEHMLFGTYCLVMWGVSKTTYNVPVQLTVLPGRGRHSSPWG